MFYINKETELTAAHIIKFIDSFKMQYLPRLKKLDRYYRNENDIKQRVFTDLTKPNNKIAHSWGNYITDTIVAIFLGEPVSYTGQDEDIEKLNYIFEQGDEQDLNTELAKDQSRYGVAYELAYIDEQADVKLTQLSPLNTICIYDDTVNSNLLYVIRFNEVKNILDDTTTTVVTLYSKCNIKEYKKTESNVLEFTSEQAHNFEIVPVSIYKNNEELLGDYELLIDLIDFYDVMESDTANAFDYYNDAYMKFMGCQMPDDITTMKEQRILEVPEGGDIQFLTKNSNDLEQENTKNRIVSDIHKFSFVPDMSDENFANNVSGIAMKYKLLGLLNKARIKRRKYKKGLQNRLWLISNILNLKSGKDLQDIKTTFKINLPNNDVEVANMINSLRGLLSSETLISQLSFIENPKEELEKLQEEQALNSYGDLFEEEKEEVEEDAE
jgi:SPP1 family phage portal protein